MRSIVIVPEYSTARRIREAPWGHDVKLIALTGWGQPKDRERTLEAGFNAHLVKPVGTTELMEAISQVGQQPRPRVEQTLN